MKHEVYIKNLVASCHANLVLLNRVYRNHETREWVKARKMFLERKLKEDGKLVCSYCKRDDLKIRSIDESTATVDHIVPISKGGKELDEENFCVCCFNCNRKKGSDSKELYLSSKYLTMRRKQLKNESS